MSNKNPKGTSWSFYKKFVISNDGPVRDTVEYTVIDIETGMPTKDWSGNKLAHYSLLEDSLKSLTGRILTIIDASIPEGKQNKCIKDLIRGEFVQEFEKFGEFLFDQAKIDKQFDNIELATPVSNEEALGA